MSTKAPKFTPVEFTVPEHAGLSSDQRTNRWRVVCPRCGTSFVPQTTMLVWHHFVCPKRSCSAGLDADYTAGKERVTLAPEVRQ